MRRLVYDTVCWCSRYLWWDPTDRTKAHFRDMDYRIPQQDLAIKLSRRPAIPKSRFVIDGVGAVNPVGRP